MLWEIAIEKGVQTSTILDPEGRSNAEMNVLSTYHDFLGGCVMMSVNPTSKHYWGALNVG